MSTKAQTIYNIVERIAPKYCAEEWDNVGLMVGRYNKDISRVLISLEFNGEVLKEALQKDIDLVITHHPLIFNALKNIRYETPQGRYVYELIKNDIDLYSCHTNLDSSVDGLNQHIAMKLGLKDIAVLDIMGRESYKKLVVFVPKGYEEIVRDAMGNAGAGYIGNYSHCTFMTGGTGTFLPHEGTNPLLGEVGKLEKADEYRIETIVPDRLLKKVISAMLKVHPYEEVAYDIYPLENKGNPYGIGRIGYSDDEYNPFEYALKVKEALNLKEVKIGGDMNKRIKKVAVVNGSGGSYVSKAYYAGADVLVTGDVTYHQCQDAKALGLAVIDAGHYGTEKHFVRFMAEYLRKAAIEEKLDFEVIENEADINPFVTY
ncbi:MAG: Nif3-like dinuclear metal center hexameric protein [Thermoanaerobacteraceae bacterium]|nr:Nif3-like dinuclear metal center hexameric protein [Thermoanaerobacteraceae bacterium]